MKALDGLGSTAPAGIAGEVAFQIGLGLAVSAALLAAFSFLPRGYPVIEVARLRENNLTAPVEETKLELLDTEIVMVEEAASLVRKGQNSPGICDLLGGRSVVRGHGYVGGHRRHAHA